MLGPCKDPKVRAMFEKIAQLREIWASLWDESDYPVPEGDDDQYTPADDSTKSLSRTPTATSLASSPFLPVTPASAATKEDQVVLTKGCEVVLGEEITAEQDEDLRKLLLEIEALEGPKWVPQVKATPVFNLMVNEGFIISSYKS